MSTMRNDEMLVSAFTLLHWLRDGEAIGMPWRRVPRGSKAQRALDEGAVPEGLAQRRGNEYRLTPLGRARHDAIWQHIQAGMAALMEEVVKEARAQ